MSPLAFVFALLSLMVSARVRFHGVPVMWLAAAIVTLLLAAAVLILARQLARDWPRAVPA